jgi:hypothetical protein
MPSLVRAPQKFTNSHASSGGQARHNPSISPAETAASLPTTLSSGIGSPIMAQICANACSISETAGPHTSTPVSCHGSIFCSGSPTHILPTRRQSAAATAADLLALGSRKDARREHHLHGQLRQRRADQRMNVSSALTSRRRSHPLSGVPATSSCGNRVRRRGPSLYQNDGYR